MSEDLKSFFRNAHIGVGLAAVFAIVGTVLFNGNDDLMALVAIGTFAIAFGVFSVLDERERRARGPGDTT